MKFVKEKSISCLICLIPFLVLLGLTKAFFSDFYLFDWMLRHWYLGLWAVSIIVSLFEVKWGYVISFSNLIAVVIGEFLGDIIRNVNMTKITPGMTDEQIDRLFEHPGVYIWLLVLLLINVVYALVFIHKKRNAVNVTLEQAIEDPPAQTDSKTNIVKNKIIPALICIAPFAILFVLTKLWFPDVYMFDWMLRRWYLCLWAIAAFVALFDAKWGCVISFSDIIAIIIGQVAGTIIRNNNISKVTPDMEAWQIARLHLHPGFEIWLKLFFALIIIYAVIRLILKKRRNSTLV